MYGEKFSGGEINGVGFNPILNLQMEEMIVWDKKRLVHDLHFCSTLKPEDEEWELHGKN